MRRALFIGLALSSMMVGHESLAIEEIKWRREKHGKAAAFASQPMRNYELPDWFGGLCFRAARSS